MSAARAYWKGQIQIAAVQFGVALYPATESANQIKFNLLDRGTGQRIRQVRTAGEDGEAVSGDNIVKGYEYSKGQYVIIEPSELKALRVPSQHTVAVTQFIELSDLRPEHFEKSYFVAPENDIQSEGFAVMRQALINTGKAAIGKVTFSGRECILAIRPVNDGGMMAYTLRYQNELRNSADFFHHITKAQINMDLLHLAETLIARKTAKFDLSKFEDGYEVALKGLVNAKLQNLPVPTEVNPTTEKRTASLLDALRASLLADEEPAQTGLHVVEAPKNERKKKVPATASKPAQYAAIN